MVSLVAEALAWGSLLVITAVETKVYIREFRWYVRFGVVYSLVGDAIVLNLILSRQELYNRSLLYFYFSEVLFRVLFGILLLVYVPDLDLYPNYTSIRIEYVDDTEYEELHGGEQICPERHVDIISKILFAWINPLMELGYKRPITKKDVWELDYWDCTETLYNKFQKCWAEECRRPKPWLLRALYSSLGGRFRCWGFISDAWNFNSLYRFMDFIFCCNNGVNDGISKLQLRNWGVVLMISIWKTRKSKIFKQTFLIDHFIRRCSADCLYYYRHYPQAPWSIKTLIDDVKEYVVR